MAHSLWHRRRNSQAAALFSARLAAAAIAIGVQLLLAQALGAEQLGLYLTATSLVSIAAVVAGGGYPNIVLKVVTGRPGVVRRLNGFARVAVVDCCVGALCMAALLAGGTRLIEGASAIEVAVVALPLLAFGRLLNAFAVAHGRPLAANLPDMLGKPMLMGGGLLVLILAGVPIDARTAAWLFVAGALLPTGFLAAVMVRAGIFSRIGAKVDRRFRKQLRRTALPLTAVSVFSAFSTEVVIVASSLFLTPAQVGIFGVSLKIAALIGFSIQAIHQVELPAIAAAYRQGLTETVKSVVIRTNRAAVLATAVGAGVIAIFAPAILALFGDGFVAGTRVLMILLAFQVVRAWLGPSVQALTLVSAQRTSSILTLVTVVAVFLGCAILIPLYGDIGAAIAASGTMLIWFGSAACFAARYGLATTGLGILNRAPWRAAAGCSVPKRSFT